MKMLEKFCLWYLKKYWNSQGYKKAVALEQQKQAENLPQFMKSGIRDNRGRGAAAACSW